MKHKLVMLQSVAGHSVGVLPEAVVAIEHAVHGVDTIATLIHLLSGVALKVVGSVADTVESLGHVAKETTHSDTAGGGGSGAPATGGKEK